MQKKKLSLSLLRSYLRSSSPMFCTRVWLYCTISENRNANVERLSWSFFVCLGEKDRVSHQKINQVEKLISSRRFLNLFSAPHFTSALPLGRGLSIGLTRGGLEEDMAKL